MKRDKKYIVGNWKMNQETKEIQKFFEGLKHNENCHQWIAPQYIHIPQTLTLKQSFEGISIGAQNCSYDTKGAYTGEVSSNSLKEIGVDFVLIGHSERRSLFNESNETLNQKTKQALESGLTVIFCIGESLEQRESGETNNVLKTQILEGLKEIQSDNLLIAYEPVWAIGTGKTATPQLAQEAHEFIREVCAKEAKLDSNSLPILYGGSVKPSNAESLLSCKDIDGALVGGASLKAEDFNALSTIANDCKNP